MDNNKIKGIFFNVLEIISPQASEKIGDISWHLIDRLENKNKYRDSLFLKIFANKFAKKLDIDSFLIKHLYDVANRLYPNDMEINYKVKDSVDKINNFFIKYKTHMKEVFGANLMLEIGLQKHQTIEVLHQYTRNVLSEDEAKIELFLFRDGNLGEIGKHSFLEKNFSVSIKNLNPEKYMMNVLLHEIGHAYFNKIKPLLKTSDRVLNKAFNYLYQNRLGVSNKHIDFSTSFNESFAEAFGVLFYLKDFGNNQENRDFVSSVRDYRAMCRYTKDYVLDEHNLDACIESVLKQTEELDLEQLDFNKCIKIVIKAANDNMEKVLINNLDKESQLFDKEFFMEKSFDYMLRLFLGVKNKEDLFSVLAMSKDSVFIDATKVLSEIILDSDYISKAFYVMKNYYDKKDKEKWNEERAILFDKYKEKLIESGIIEKIDKYNDDIINFIKKKQESSDLSLKDVTLRNINAKSKREFKYDFYLEKNKEVESIGRRVATLNKKLKGDKSSIVNIILEAKFKMKSRRNFKKVDSSIYLRQTYRPNK